MKREFFLKSGIDKSLGKDVWLNFDRDYIDIVCRLPNGGSGRFCSALKLKVIGENINIDDFIDCQGRGTFILNTAISLLKHALPGKKIKGHIVPENSSPVLFLKEFYSKFGIDVSGVDDEKGGYFYGDVSNLSFVPNKDDNSIFYYPVSAFFDKETNASLAETLSNIKL